MVPYKLWYYYYIIIIIYLFKNFFLIPPIVKVPRSLKQKLKTKTKLLEWH